jgi:hypothetical protein
MSDSAYSSLEVPSDAKGAGEPSPPTTLNTAYFSGLGEAHDSVRNNVEEALQSSLQKKGSRVSILLKKYEDTAAAARVAMERELQKSPKPADLNSSGYHESIPSEALPMNNSSGYFESTAAAHENDSEESEDEFNPLSHVKGYAASDFDDLLGEDVPNTKNFEDTSSPLTSPRKEAPVKITKLIEEFKNRDWSAEYHSLLAQIGYEHAQPEENFDKICQLVMTLNDLAEDFLTAAETYARVIISKSCANQEDKDSIKIVEINKGIAGGKKFKEKNIFLKFALDVPISKTKSLYSGDDNAAKAAGHELRNLNNFALAYIPGIFFPLMCTIDWCGFRLLAISVVPTNSKSIVYGSNDGAQTVYRDEEVDKLMTIFANSYNIKPHNVGFNTKTPKQLASCGDFEVHRVNDKLYGLDFARFSIPEGTSTVQEDQWYKHLRPELTKMAPQKLNPDCYCKMDADPADEVEKDKEAIVAATKMLHEQVIPNAAKTLKATYSEEKAASLTPAQLVAIAHRNGINVRYIGELRHYLIQEGSPIQRAAMTEMVSRVIKCDINAKMREAMVENKEPFKVVFDNIIINTMNNFLEDTRLWKATEIDDKHLKETPLKVLIAEKFGDQALTADENTNDVALDVDVPALIARIEQHLNIEFVSGMKEFAVLGSQSFFTKSIAKRAPKVKHMSFVDLSKAVILMHQGVKTSNMMAKKKMIGDANYGLSESDVGALQGLDPEIKSGLDIFNKHAVWLINYWGECMLHYTEHFLTSGEVSELARELKLVIDKYTLTHNTRGLIKVLQFAVEKVLSFGDNEETNKTRVDTMIDLLQHLLSPKEELKYYPHFKMVCKMTQKDAFQALASSLESCASKLAAFPEQQALVKNAGEFYASLAH